MYGSLRRGEGNPEASALAAGSHLLGAAHVRGSLVDVQGHPGLVPGPRGRVDGQLVHVTDAGLWDVLDAHEGVGEPGWDHRGLVVALDQHNEPRSAWAYLAPPQTSQPRISTD